MTVIHAFVVLWYDATRIEVQENKMVKFDSGHDVLGLVPSQWSRELHAGIEIAEISQKIAIANLGSLKNQYMLFLELMRMEWEVINRYWPALLFSDLAALLFSNIAYITVDWEDHLWRQTWSMSTERLTTTSLYTMGLTVPRSLEWIKISDAHNT